MSCTNGFSDEKYKEFHDRIPGSIELELAIAFDDDHPDYRYAEQRGFCGDELDNGNHLECKRKKEHKGKHWCYECGESWK